MSRPDSRLFSSVVYSRAKMEGLNTKQAEELCHRMQRAIVNYLQNEGSDETKEFLRQRGEKEEVKGKSAQVQEKKSSWWSRLNRFDEEEIKLAKKLYDETKEAKGDVRAVMSIANQIFSDPSGHSRGKLVKRTMEHLINKRFGNSADENKSDESAKKWFYAIRRELQTLYGNDITLKAMQDTRQFKFAVEGTVLQAIANGDVRDVCQHLILRCNRYATELSAPPPTPSATR